MIDFVRVLKHITAAAVTGLACIGAWAQEPIMVEDFEDYAAGEAPFNWKILNRNTRSVESLDPDLVRDQDYFEAVLHGNNTVLRAYTRNETVQIARLNGDGYEWDLQTHPVLSWQWRATALPEGAREDRRGLNDTGAALYVMFDCEDWLGRPCSIKYTYSSTLATGTTARYGPLRVLVVSSQSAGTGEWIQLERNVADDYALLFGDEDPPEPLLIMLWSDSDSTGGVSEVYFDDIVLKPLP